MRKLFLFLSAVLVISCSSVDCPFKNMVRTYYNVYDHKGALLQLPDTLTIFTKRVDGSDTILLNCGIGLQTFGLPVSYTRTEDTLYFHFYNNDYNVYDTVWIKKENYPHFESMECKVAYFHKLTEYSYTTNCIDSLILKNDKVDYDDQTTHFYLYPDTIRY
jgi:hypothetical protein